MNASTETFVGKWESIGSEVRPNPRGGQYFLRRYFHNKENEARGTLVFYTNESCTEKNTTLEVVGPYTFLRDSSVAEGAVEVDFEFTAIAVTPHSQQMVNILNGASANYLKTWVPNLRQQVDVPGQSIMGVTVGLYKEYDLVKIDGELLYYGARPADGSMLDTPAKRPTALQVPLKRVSEFSVKF